MKDDIFGLDLTQVQVKINSRLLGEMSPMRNMANVSNDLVKDGNFDTILDVMLSSIRKEIVKFMKKAKVIDKKGRWIKK